MNSVDKDPTTPTRNGKNDNHDSLKGGTSAGSPSLLSQSLLNGAPVVPQSPPRVARSHDLSQDTEPLYSISIAQYEQQRQQQLHNQEKPEGTPRRNKLTDSPMRNWLPNNSDATVETSNIISAMTKESLLDQNQYHQEEQSQNATLIGTSPPTSTQFQNHLNGDRHTGTVTKTILKNADDLSPKSDETPRRNIMGTKVEHKYPITTSNHPTPNSVYYTFDSYRADNDVLLPSQGDDSSPETLSPTTGHSWSSSIHAQSLLLGIAFMAIWTPNNAMAPNLTAMASDFAMESEYERDLYLGSYISLALGVFCLPISALLGFMADFYSRKYLFLACVVGGSMSTLWTAHAQTFGSLFWARLSCGGCMSASVPVAFSLLGDLFAVEERNAASSGLTSMMGLGIIIGQVYAGTVGPQRGWPHVFVVSALLQSITALFVLLWVQEPTRGGKEKALQDMISSGKTYDRQLTLKGFMDAMHKNRSNSILLWQGFFTSLPWGCIFVFLNDFLSQEKGFSVPDATLLVMMFGVGCAIGGITGGYFGQLCLRYDRKYLPWFMAITTALGILPFIGLLETNFDHDKPYSKNTSVGYLAITYAILCGTVASLPSVNVRPCIINVNPPETRGAALTASNLFITLGRGIGPSCITLLGIVGLSRENAFNFTLTVFWIITAAQLMLLGYTLPKDQDDMEAELERYAALQVGSSSSGSGSSTDEEADVTLENEATSNLVDGQQQLKTSKNMEEGDAIMIPKLTGPPRPRRDRSPLRRIFGENGGRRSPRRHHHQRNHRPPFANSPYRPSLDDPTQASMTSMEEYMTSINNFDGLAARQSLQFVSQGIKELKDELTLFGTACGPDSCGPSGGAMAEDDDDDIVLRNTTESGAVDLRVPIFEPDASNNGGGISLAEMDRRKRAWEHRRMEQQQQQAGVPNERTPLV